MALETDRSCPACGCFSYLDAYEKSGILYCCEACAIDDDCGCWDDEEEEW